MAISSSYLYFRIGYVGYIFQGYLWTPFLDIPDIVSHYDSKLIRDLML